MAKKDRVSEPKTIDSQGNLIDPTPAIRPRSRNLATIDSVRLEMARVYRDMKHGSIATQDGTRLVYVLSEIRKSFELVDIERRISAIESARSAT